MITIRCVHTHIYTCVCVYRYTLLTYLAAVEFLKIYTSPQPDSVCVSPVRRVYGVYVQGLAFAWCSFFGIITPFSLTIGGLKPYVRYIYFSHNIFSHDDDCTSTRLKGCAVTTHVSSTYSTDVSIAKIEPVKRKRVFKPQPKKKWYPLLIIKIKYRIRTTSRTRFVRTRVPHTYTL